MLLETINIPRRQKKEGNQKTEGNKSREKHTRWVGARGLIWAAVVDVGTRQGGRSLKRETPQGRAAMFGPSLGNSLPRPSDLIKSCLELANLQGSGTFFPAGQILSVLVRKGPTKTGSCI